MSDVIGAAGIALISALTWFAFTHRETFNRTLWPILGVMAAIWGALWLAAGERDWLFIGLGASAYLILVQRISALAAEDAEKKAAGLNKREAGKVKRRPLHKRPDDL